MVDKDLLNNGIIDLEIDYVKFKSNPYNYEMEKSGLKNNTVRIYDSNDSRFDKLGLWKMHGVSEDDFIIIENNETNETFMRQVKSVVIYENIYIITWRS